MTKYGHVEKKWVPEHKDLKILNKLLRRDGHWFLIKDGSEKKYFTFNIRKKLYLHEREPFYAKERPVSLEMICFSREGFSYVKTLRLLDLSTLEIRYRTESEFLPMLYEMYHFGYSGHLKPQSIKNPFKK